MKNLRSSKASISINSCTELSKTKFSLWVSLMRLYNENDNEKGSHRYDINMGLDMITKRSFIKRHRVTTSRYFG